MRLQQLSNGLTASETTYSFAQIVCFPKYGKRLVGKYEGVT